jgi:MFS family permease
MIGPLAGGLIVGLLHWRVIFFVNLPIGAVGLFLVFRHLPDYRAEKTGPLDWVGLLLFGAGVALLSTCWRSGVHHRQPADRDHHRPAATLQDAAAAPRAARSPWQGARY